MFNLTFLYYSFLWLLIDFWDWSLLDVLDVGFVSAFILCVQLQVLRHEQSLEKSVFILTVEQDTQLHYFFLQSAGTHPHFEFVCGLVEFQHLNILPNVNMVHISWRFCMWWSILLRKVEQLLIGDFFIPHVIFNQVFGTLQSICLELLLINLALMQFIHKPLQIHQPNFLILHPLIHMHPQRRLYLISGDADVLVHLLHAGFRELGGLGPVESRLGFV